jgi:methanogenic corrinoid protein MtbC1
MQGQAPGAGGGPGSAQQVGRLVRTIEEDVIPRLAFAHRAPDPAPAALPEPLADGEVASFAEQIIDGSDAVIASLVERLLWSGVTVETLYLDLFSPAARRLGRLWDEDECDFTTVTSGLGRLQRLVRDLSSSFGTEVLYPTHGRRVLLAQPPQEQHSFGLSMLAEFFRRDGWLVEGGIGAAARDPVARVRAEWFDVVGFSVGSRARVEWVRDKIAALRPASRNAAVVVLVGGPLFSAGLDAADLLGADGSAPDAREVPALAERLVSVGAARS